VKIDWQAPPLSVVTHAFENALARFWSWREADLEIAAKPVGGAPPSNLLQVSMNLVMPLRDPTAVGMAHVMGAVGATIDEVFVGMDNVGTVHFARFDLVAGNLCMFSIFDGDPEAYIRDFILMFGRVFDALMDLVKDPPPTPSESHVEEFIEWIMRHDAFHTPGSITDTFPKLDNIENAGRDLVLMMERNRREGRAVELGIYRRYPGFSAAQIRSKLGVGW
jgi:hypothetical protein